ncbi:MAG: glycosyltransferase family 2 protein, partial [Planctomycetes bacterium]|nr:glycosyltransferase family 2 protein [Planctomycetota bacterium]
MNQEPFVVAVVPVYNRLEKTLRFIKNFSYIKYLNKKIIIVDDNSTDGTAEIIRNKFPEVTVIDGSGDLWWSGGTNVAVKKALEDGADYVLTINDDCIMDENFLANMVNVAGEDNRYIVGCRLMFQDDTDRIWGLGATCYFRGWEMYQLNYGGMYWSKVKSELSDDRIMKVDTMPGNGVLISREVFERVGFYDEINMPQYHADTDFVSRAKNSGYTPVIAAESVIYNDIITAPLVQGLKALI